MEKLVEGEGEIRNGERGEEEGASSLLLSEWFSDG